MERPKPMVQFFVEIWSVLLKVWVVLRKKQDNHPWERSLVKHALEQIKAEIKKRFWVGIKNLRITVTVTTWKTSSHHQRIFLKFNLHGGMKYDEDEEKVEMIFWFLEVE